MRDRDRIAKELNKPEAGIGLHERELQISAMVLEVLLDIRDLLTEVRDRNYVVDFVPPDYDERQQGETAK